MNKYYFVLVENCEPCLVGPFDTANERDKAANKAAERSKYGEATYWMDLRDGEPYMGSFCDLEEG